MPYYWLVPVLVVVAVVLFAHVTMILATVQGHSMSPTLEPGDRVLVLRRWAARKPRPGDIVVADLPMPVRSARSGPARRGLYIKRMAGVEGDRIDVGAQVVILARGQAFIVGDNAAHSFDSRQYGAIATHDIVGRVLSRVFTAGAGRPAPDAARAADGSR